MAEDVKSLDTTGSPTASTCYCESRTNRLTTHTSRLAYLVRVPPIVIARIKTANRDLDAPCPRPVTKCTRCLGSLPWRVSLSRPGWLALPLWATRAPGTRQSAPSLYVEPAQGPHRSGAPAIFQLLRAFRVCLFSPRIRDAQRKSSVAVQAASSQRQRVVIGSQWQEAVFPTQRQTALFLQQRKVPSLACFFG